METVEVKKLPPKVISAFGFIDETMSSTIIDDLLNSDFENEYDKEIHMYVCSEGGMLSHCFAIIDFINILKAKHSLKIYTYAFGEVASGGFFLFLLGDVRYLSDNCHIFVHEHITCGEDSKTYTERIKADKTIEKELYEQYRNYTATRLELTRAKARSLLAKNKYLNRREIEKFNILGNTNEK